MLSALSKAFQQLRDPGTKNILFISVGMSLILSITLWMIITSILITTSAFEIRWVDWLVDFFGSSLALLLTILFFPSFISVITCFLLEQVADAVDARYYPSHKVARNRALPEVIVQTLKFFVLSLVLNTLLLPSVFVLPLFPFIFYTVNGHLFGREYFEIAALRRMSSSEAQNLRKAKRIHIIVIGSGVTVLMTLPGINLLTPIIATATMVHLVERWRVHIRGK